MGRTEQEGRTRDHMILVDGHVTCGWDEGEDEWWQRNWNTWPPPTTPRAVTASDCRDQCRQPFCEAGDRLNGPLLIPAIGARSLLSWILSSRSRGEHGSPTWLLKNRRCISTPVPFLNCSAA